MDSQVDRDGLDYESSLPYHGLVTEIILDGAIAVHKV